jgi:hypothetical protein
MKSVFLQHKTVDVCMRELDISDAAAKLDSLGMVSLFVMLLVQGSLLILLKPVVDSATLYSGSVIELMMLLHLHIRIDVLA